MLLRNTLIYMSRKNIMPLRTCNNDLTQTYTNLQLNCIMLHRDCYQLLQEASWPITERDARVKMTNQWQWQNAISS